MHILMKINACEYNIYYTQLNGSRWGAYFVYAAATTNIISRLNWKNTLNFN